jgi:hypothetical protein
MSGVFSTGRHSPDATQWGPGGAFEADHLETFGVPVGEFVRGYATVDIDEKNLAVRIAFVNGLTGEETYVVQELGNITGDLDGDGTVGIVDFLLLLAAWGPCEAPCPPACVGDIDGDCDVGITDMLTLLANWD